MAPAFNALTTTARELQTLLDAKVWTTQDLVDAYLVQIQQHNKAGLKLNAIVSTPSRTLLYKDADKLDQERAEGQLSGPLHGIPIVVKDAICTAEHRGMPTTLGSSAFTTTFAKDDASVVRLLSEQGALILGKSSLTELCGTKGDNLTTGWSPISGQTQSAYVSGGVKEGDLIFGHSTPGGSSSGSAVSVSAGFTPLALGTETDGSLICPAHRAGLFAFKAATGTIPIDGIFKLTSYDSVGAMAKSPFDIVLLLNAIVQPPPAYDTAALESAQLKDMAVGFVEPKLWRLPEVICAHDENAELDMDQAFIHVKDVFINSGVKVQFPLELPLASALSYNGMDAIGSTLLHELKSNVKEFTDLLIDPAVRTLDQIIEFNAEHSDIELPTGHSDQSALLKAQLDNSSLDDVQAAQRYAKELAGPDGIARALQQYGVDVIVAPGDSAITSLATSAGCPIAAVPNGVLNVHGRPHGLSIVSKIGRERDLLRFMFAFEKAFPSRPAPPALMQSRVQGNH